MKKFEFAKYYDITEIARENGTHTEQEYAGIFLCVDTHVYWLARIVKNVRFCEVEGYVTDEDSMILERNNIDKPSRRSGIETMSQIINILNDDCFDNYNCMTVSDLDDAIDNLDNGFGMGTVEK